MSGTAMSDRVADGLVSGLAGHIRSLLVVKHAVGLPYVGSERHLRRFDEMCARDYPGQDTLTREAAMTWVTARPGEHVNGQIRRITPVRQLGKHIVGLGLVGFVIPAGIPGGRTRYQPHVFSHEQLRALFDAADQIRSSPWGGARELIIPTIFRMIYCLGLRPGEARRLRRNDVDLAGGAVSIRESKGHRERVVFMSPDLHDHCRTYDAQINARHPDRVAFFPNPKGDIYNPTTVNCWFAELLAGAGESIVSRPGSPPRPHDLRHAHVVENINRWASGGRDPQALVPYLSVHLGHSNPADTWYYFHLADDFHPDLRQLANCGIESTLPEVSHGLR